MCVLAATRGDVFSHGLPTVDPRRQRLRHRRADAASTSPDAGAVPCGHGWQPAPSTPPETGTWPGGLRRPTACTNGRYHTKWSVTLTLTLTLTLQHLLMNACVVDRKFILI